MVVSTVVRVVSAIVLPVDGVASVCYSVRACFGLVILVQLTTPFVVTGFKCARNHKLTVCCSDTVIAYVKEPWLEMRSVCRHDMSAAVDARQVECCVPGPVMSE